MTGKNWRGAGTLGTAWMAGVSYENDICRAVALRGRDGQIHTKVEKIGSVTDVLDSSYMQVLNMAVGLGMNGAFARGLLRDFFAVVIPLLLPIWGLPFWAEFPARLGAYVALLLFFRLISPARDRYHGAEHKVLNCDREGLDLTVENAKAQSPIIGTCGTVAGAWKMLLALLAASALTMPRPWLSCTLAIGVYVALDYGVDWFWERFVRKKDSLLARTLVRCGMAVQRLYLTEPGEAELEVALAAYKLSIGQQVKIRIGKTTAIIRPGAGSLSRRRRKR